MLVLGCPHTAKSYFSAGHPQLTSGKGLTSLCCTAVLQEQPEAVQERVLTGPSATGVTVLGTHLHSSPKRQPWVWRAARQEARHATCLVGLGAQLVTQAGKQQATE